MELNNYLKIIIEGLIEVENLKTYFKRLQKVNERDNFITKIEFYTKLTNVTIDLKVKCKERFNESKNELYKVLSLKKAKNEDTKEIEKEIKTITPDMLPLNLMHITNSQFRGTLSYSQMEYVESIILEILKNEKDLINTTKQPQQKETKNPDEVKENKYLEIFRNDLGYSIFLGLHNIYKLKPKKQANYSFLFYALGKGYLVCSGSGFITFLAKLNIHIDKIDSRQSGTNNKRDLFNSIQDKFLKAL
jgi:hypothetical protein